MAANFPGIGNMWNVPTFSFDNVPTDYTIPFPVVDASSHNMTSYQEAYLTNELRKEFAKRQSIDPLLVEISIREAKRINKGKGFPKIHATAVEITIKGKDLSQNQRSTFANIMKKVSVK